MKLATNLSTYFLYLVRDSAPHESEGTERGGELLFELHSLSLLPPLLHYPYGQTQYQQPRIREQNRKRGIG